MSMIPTLPQSFKCKCKCKSKSKTDNNPSNRQSFIECIHSGDRTRLESNPLFKRYKSYAETRFNESLVLKEFNGALHDKNLWIVVSKQEQLQLISTIKMCLGAQRVFVKPSTHMWDGYKEHPCVIFSPSISFVKRNISDLKHWSDRYPFLGETRRGAMPINPISLFVWITSASPTRILGDRFEFNGLSRRYRVIETGIEIEHVIENCVETMTKNLSLLI